MKKLLFVVAAFACAEVLAECLVLDYVQDGLLGHWDAIDNQGYAAHSDSATTWVDVVSGRSFALYGATVNANSIAFAGNSNSCGLLSADDSAATFAKAANGTVELVFSTESTANWVALQSASSGCAAFGRYSGNFIQSNSSSAMLPGSAVTLGTDQPNTVAIRYTSGMVAVNTSGETYVNGESKTTLGSREYWSGAGAQTLIGKRGNGAMPFSGKIYAIRVYSRRLTAEEIAHNAELDRQRFVEGTGRPLSDMLRVDAIPDKFGPAENYGLRMFKSGETKRFSMPAATVDPDSGIRCRCTGWMLKDVDGTIIESGSGSVCDYTHPGSPRRLVWQWQADAWPTGDGVRYVSEEGDDANSGMDWLHAYKSVQTGIDNVGADGAVLIAAGTYDSAVTVALADGVSLVGCAKTNVASVLRLTATGDRNQNVLKITASAGSVVTNLTLTNELGKDGSGVEMDSGLLTHCVVRDCRTANFTDNGGGINMTGGTVRFCDITGCIAKDSGNAYSYGGGIYMTDGLVENCRIVDNGHIDEVGAQGSGGGVYMTGGTLRGCLVTGNRKHKDGSGVYARGGTVENCTIVGNVPSVAAATASGVYIEGASTVFRNNIVWGNTDFAGTAARDWSAGSLTEANVYNNDCTSAIPGENNLTVNPQFVDAAARDYRLGFSDCVDGGADQDWMPEATDLDGNKRVVGRAVDLGCYERAAAQELECSFVSEVVDTTLAANRVAFAATVSGDTEGLVYYWTFTREDGLVSRLSGASCGVVTNLFATGSWDARLDVTNGALSSASSTIAAAVKVRANVVYVKANGTPVFPYETEETATDSIDEAFSLLGEGGTMYVDEGEYVMSEPIVLGPGNGSRIIAPKGPAKTAIRVANVDKFTSQKYRAVTLSKASACVSGVTFAGGYAGPHYTGPAYGIYGVVSMTEDAIVTNCVFRDIREAGYGTNVEGMGVRMSAGLLVDCRFANISSQGSGGMGMNGAALRMTGGTADRIAVDGCFCRSPLDMHTSGFGDIVYASGASTVVKNVLVTGCSTTKSVPVGMADGSVINCTIVCNTNNAPLAWTDDHQGVHENDQTAGVSVTGTGTIRNCIAVDNWSINRNCITNLSGTATYTLVNDGDGSFATAENHNLVADPRFRNAACGDYRLRPFSPAIDAGDWSALGATKAEVRAQRDLLGASRLFCGALDMGCFEAVVRGLTVMVK